MTPERQAQIETMAFDLVASCAGGRDHWEEIEALTRDEAEYLDTLALECVTCNQWYEASSMHDGDSGYVCEDCST